ncbi:MAG: hypothetical protein OIF32_05410 [Campylobacterales bacterium]|nr:hypothetical protein [Campylobacterales bacterium]
MIKEKTTSQRILEIYKLAEEHFGDAKFVGIKYDIEDGWVAKIKFSKDSDFRSISAADEEPRTALKKLKKRMKKIINRYQTV